MALLRSGEFAQGAKMQNDKCRMQNGSVEMETKKIVEKLNSFCENFFLKNVVEMDISLFKEAAERLEELEKQLSEKQPEWISVEDAPPKDLGYYLVTVLDLDTYKYYTTIAKWHGHMFTAQDDTLGNNLSAIAWLPKSANPAPLVPTFKDVFLRAFPGAVVLPKSGSPVVCAKQVFPQLGDDESPCDMCCAECWNRPYYEPQEEGGE